MLPLAQAYAPHAPCRAWLSLLVVTANQLRLPYVDLYHAVETLGIARVLIINSLPSLAVQQKNYVLDEFFQYFKKIVKNNYFYSQSNENKDLLNIFCFILLFILKYWIDIYIGI